MLHFLAVIVISSIHCLYCHFRSSSSSATLPYFSLACCTFTLSSSFIFFVPQTLPCSVLFPSNYVIITPHFSPLPCHFSLAFSCAMPSHTPIPNACSFCWQKKKKNPKKSFSSKPHNKSKMRIYKKINLGGRAFLHRNISSKT